MIIEVRTRTVGYKACVKNSLSFSTLPTKPFPRWKDTELLGEEKAAWEQRKVEIRMRTKKNVHCASPKLKFQ